MKPAVVSVSVFVGGSGGGNPCTVVTRPSALSDQALRETANVHGHECVFVLPAMNPSADVRLRFFSPSGEMSMCGHASLGAVWALGREGIRGRHLRIETKSGVLRALAFANAEPKVAIACPSVGTAPIEPVLSAFNLLPGDLATGTAFHAFLARPKTIVQLADVKTLHALAPTLATIAAACSRLGTTGLYPWARAADGTIHARQFPFDAGYLEDPATGIAAVGLYRVLGAFGRIDVFQGEAMGFPSRISVEGDSMGSECWMSGRVLPLEGPRRVPA